MPTLNERLKELRKQMRANRALERVTVSDTTQDDRRYQQMRAALRYCEACPSHGSALRKLRSIGF